MPQFAIQEARQAFRNIAAEFRGWDSLLALGYTPRIILIGTGRLQALASIFGFQFSGASAGLIRTIRLLIRLPGFNRKLRLLVSTIAFFREQAEDRMDTRQAKVSVAGLPTNSQYA